MYNNPYFFPYQFPYYVNAATYNYSVQPSYWNENIVRSFNGNGNFMIKDYGKKPFVINIENATKRNNTFRTALWTGKYLQTTLMNIDVGEDIGLEMHPDVDQFLRVEQGQGIVQMGKNKNNLTFTRNVFDDFAIFIPAGTWHNLTNTGNIPLKLYSIYAPPNHPFGTVHVTKQDAIASEEGYSQ